MGLIRDLTPMVAMVVEAVVFVVVVSSDGSGQYAQNMGVFLTVFLVILDYWAKAFTSTIEYDNNQIDHLAILTSDDFI